jgi:hypothetical protein
MFQRCIRAIAMMTEAARTSETLVNFYQTTQCNNPEDGHLRTHHGENLFQKVIYEVMLHDICYVHSH